MTFTPPTWKERNDGWEHTDVLDRKLQAKFSRFHGLMLSVDGHWVYVDTALPGLLDYIKQQTEEPS